ncbi:MAG: hypothetical protein ACPGWR_28420 [Ardenticatenaceae bacterium]
MSMKVAWKFLISLIMLYMVSLVLLQPGSNSAAPLLDEGGEEAEEQDVFVSEAVEPGMSVAARDLPLADREPLLDREINPRQNPDFLDGVGENIVGPEDPLLQKARRNTGRAPAPMLNFEGQASPGVTPPDTVGEVGPNHYVQMVNVTFAIYDKSGKQVLAPRDINQLWQDSTGQNICKTKNAGDPIVLYDQLADRWLLSQFARPNHMCIAISQTGDPAGSYYTYQFDVQDFPDYFKFGVWPDGYYMSANEQRNTGYTAYAFDRTKMLAGEAASFQKADQQKNLLLPSDLDGSTEPPNDSPNYFYTFKDDEYSNHQSDADVVELWAFDVDWNETDNTSFTRVASIPMTSFIYTVCGFFDFNCIPQPGTSRTLDSVSEWPMWRAQYRNFGTHETLVGNFTVDVGKDQAGIRWFELRKADDSNNGAWTLHQEGTHAPDKHHRWMGSMAMDQSGNIALGYSISSSSLNPGIRYTTRLASDPLDTLRSEETLVSGTASQTNSNRWGDYSSMNVDPADDCTFWYTNEYVSENRWSTRIGTFKIPSCGNGPQATATPTVTPSPTATPIPPATLCETRNLTIPANSDNVSSQPVSEPGHITDLDVKITANHDVVSDLVFTIEHDQNRVTLIDQPGIPATKLGCQEADIDVTLDDQARVPVEEACADSSPAINGIFTPHEALTLFDGDVLSGTWTLTITNTQALTQGMLIEWCLVARTSPPYDFYLPLIFR